MESEASGAGGGQSLVTGQLVVGWTKDDVVREKLAAKSQQPSDGDEDEEGGGSSTTGIGESQEGVTEAEGYRRAAQTAHWTTARLRKAFLRRQNSMTLSESQQQFKELHSRSSLHKMRLPRSEQDPEQEGPSRTTLLGRPMAALEAVHVENEGGDSRRRVTRGASGHFEADQVVEIACAKETHQS